MVMLFLVFLLGILAVVGVTGFLRMDRAGRALGRAVMDASGKPWEKQIALQVGPLTAALVQLGLGFVPMDPEPRAALRSFKGAAVGVYNLPGDPRDLNHRSILARADKAMSAQGWNRVVCVSQDRQLVAVYAPRGGVGVHKVKCCLAVLQERQLVVVSASGDLRPLVELVMNSESFHKAAASHLPREWVSF
jgi:hypothetical protein